MADLASTIWRDFVTDGVPLSGKNKPSKSKIREWGTNVETLANLAFTSSLVYSTRAALYANLVPAANTPALVIGDPTAGYDGIYGKVGATTTGSWTRIGDVPGYSFVRATDAGAGTANAIVATTDASLSATDAAQLIALNIYEDNTGSPVTASFNGGPALTIKTNSGNDVSAGGLAAGMIVLGFVSGSTFRLISDQASAAVLAAAEDARDEAVAAASSVQSVLATRAYAIASYHPVSAPDFIDVAGYATVADGGGGRYKKVVSEPAHDGKLQITLDDAVTTAWYELVADAPNVQMFGGGTGNAATDGAALEALIAYVATNAVVGADIYIARGTYAMTEGAVLPAGNRWKFNGSTLSFSGVLSADLADVGGAPRAHVAGTGTKAAMPDLDSDVAEGDFVIAFASAHGLAAGDVFEIYNPTDYSWSNERTYYRAGELCRVMAVVDSTTVWVDRGLYASYAAADVEISKFTPWTGSVEDVTIIGNGDTAAVTYGLAVDIASDVSIKGVAASGVSYNTHYIARAIDFTMDRCRGAEDGAMQFGGDYGLGVYSSQRGLITNSHFVAASHAIAHGTVGGSVPFRDIHYRHSSARAYDGTVTGWDFHSVGDHCSVEHCTAGSGLNDGVKNMTIENCKLHNVVGYPHCYLASQQVGGTARLINNDYIVNGTYTPGTAVGIIHAAGSTSHSYLREDKYYDIQGVKIRGTGQRSKNVMAIWSANATYRVSVSIDGLDDPDANATREQVLHAHGGSGSPVAAHYYSIANVHRLRSGVNYALYSDGMPNPVACQYPDQRGFSTLSPSTSASSVNGSAVTLPHGYPEANIHAMVAGSSLTLGGDRWQQSFSAVSGAGFTPVGATSDGGNFASTTSGFVYWQASLTRG